MTTEALTAAGLAPTGIAGGRVSAWGGNARVAGDDLFVVEADEYDKAFLTLYPTVAIVNNVEPDHLECYGSMAALEDAFVEFAGRAETAVVSADDPGHGWSRAGWDAGSAASASRTMPMCGSPMSPSTPTGPRPRSAGAGAARSPSDSGCRGSQPAQRRRRAGRHRCDRRRPRPGGRGAGGVRAAWAGGSSGWASTAASRWWTTTRTTRRSWSATLAAARQAYPGRRLVAVFQPHLYSRTAAHGQAMGEALAAADLVVVTEVYAAREQPMDGVSGRQVADAARRAGADATVRADAGRTWAAGCTMRSCPATSSSRLAPATSRGSVPSSSGGWTPPEARLEAPRRPRTGARALVRASRPLRGLDFFRVQAGGDRRIAVS